MNINCKIAEDLLPLYLDDSCSEDSRTALEYHLQNCQACRTKMARMQSGITDSIQMEKSVPELTKYSKKVRNHRIQIAVLVTFFTIILSAIFALSFLALRDMHKQSSPHVFKVEAGTYNLAVGDLETQAEKINQYVLYTNNAEIAVTVQGEGSFQGSVMLWDTENSRNFIQTSDVNEKTNTCTFMSLSAAKRYKITCNNLDGTTITVSEGRTISFWSSLKSVLNEIIRG